MSLTSEKAIPLSIARIAQESRSHSELYLGVDLGHPRRRTTGIALLCARCLKLWLLLAYPVHVVQLCAAVRPSVIAIDAPLTLPRRGIERELERICRRLGYKLIPPLLGPMRRLTITGLVLKEVLEQMGLTVIETHPRSAAIAAGFRNEQELVRALGLQLESVPDHIVDAVVSCLVALAYAQSQHLEIRDSEGNSLVLLTQDFVEKWRRSASSLESSQHQT